MTLPKYIEYKDSGVQWIGAIPTHWRVLPIKRVAMLRSGDFINSNAIEDDGQYPVFGGNGLRGYTGAYTHDGVFPLIGRQGALCGNINYGRGKFWASEHAIVAALRADADAVWLGETLRAMNLNQYSVSAAQPGLAVEAVAALRIPVPSRTEQSAIAAFLDREISKIDALVAEQEKLVALLREKRQAVISHAVTKGLNPDAPMKTSGIEWLGDVPAHWNVKQLKHLIQEGSSISYGIVQPGEPQDIGVPFVQTTNMSNGSFGLDELQKTTEDIAAMYPRSKLSGGEVLLGIRASIGAAFVAPENLRGTNLSRGVARIECGEEVQPEFLVHYLASEPVGDYWGSSKQGSTFNEVSIETVRELHVPVPPANEQTDISSSVYDQDSRFSVLIAGAEEAVQLLGERRSALISAAVTGQIDVRAFNGEQIA